MNAPPPVIEPERFGIEEAPIPNIIQNGSRRVSFYTF